MNARPFDLWLEFEWWESQPDADPTTDFFNMQISLPNGKRYALNVWTFNYIAVARQHDQATGDNSGGAYVLPPDLLIERLDRPLLEQIVADLIQTKHLREDWRIPDDNSARDPVD